MSPKNRPSAVRYSGAPRAEERLCEDPGSAATLAIRRLNLRSAPAEFLRLKPARHGVTLFDLLNLEERIAWPRKPKSVTL